MLINPMHPWNLSTAEARQIQLELAARVDTTKPLKAIRTVAAADVSFNKFSEWLHAAVVVVQADTLEVVERVGWVGKATFPYVPGLLSFRECPPVLAAFQKLQTVPDVVLGDGQGYSHPRRIGFASHLGLCLGIPTIGCAKSRLCGAFDEPGPNRGERAPLIDQDEVIGSVVRTRSRVKPLFVSAGHLCDLESAVKVVLATTIKYRLPVPSRMAHDFVNQLRREAGEGAERPA